MASQEKLRKKLYSYMDNINDEKNLNSALKLLKGYLDEFDENDLNAFYSLILKNDLCEFVNSKLNLNIIDLCLKALNSSDSDFINYIKNNRILLENPRINRRLNDILSKKSIYDKAAIISYIGIYNDVIEDVFKNYDENFVKRIIKNYKNTEYYEYAIKKAAEFNKNFLRELADYYSETGALKNLKAVLDDIIKNNINCDISHYFYVLGDYENAIRYAKSENAEIADSYFKLGMLLNALDVYINIFRNYDRSVITKIIEIERELKNYREMNIYIDMYERENGPNKKLMLYKIDGFIYTGKYELANSYIEKYIQNFGLDADITMERLKFYAGIKDYYMLYNACLDALKNNIRNDDIYLNIIKYYYYNMNYESIIKFIIENNLESRFPGYYISSMIYNNKDVELNYIDRHVLNAIFSMYRSDEKLDNLKSNDYRINAIKSFIKGEGINDFNDRSSAATYYISIVRSFDFNPENIILEVDAKYKEIYDVISTVRGIINGHFDTDLYDSEFFLYPYINTMLRLKKTDLAFLELQRINNDDPFYYYFIGKYYYVKNEFNKTLKFTEKALSLLKNSYFIAIHVSALIKLERYDDAIKYMHIARDLGLYNTFNILYNTKDLKLNEYIIENIKDIEDINIYRMLRKYCNKTESIKYSALILTKSISVYDYLYHYSILRSLNNDSALSFLLRYSFKFPVFYAILSRIFYDRRDLEKFIINYNNYISLTRIYNINIEYKLAIKKNFEYLDYYFNEQGLYRDLMYLYIFENKFTSMAKNVDKFIENGLTKDIINLWHESEIKKAIIDYAYNRMNKKLIYTCIKNCTGNEQISMASRLYKKTGDSNDGVYLSAIMFRHGMYKDLFKFLISNYIKYKKDIFLELFYIFSFKARNFNGIINAYSNGVFIENRAVVANVIRAMAAALKIDSAKRTLNRYNYIFNKRCLSELNNLIENYTRFSRIIGYAGILFTYEYKNKTILKRDNASVAIPENYIDPVFSFIESDKFYMYREDNFYNDIIKNIKDGNFTINNIYHYVNDVLLAKDIYLYVKMEPISQYT